MMPRRYICFNLSVLLLNCFVGLWVNIASYKSAVKERFVKLSDDTLTDYDSFNMVRYGIYVIAVCYKPNERINNIMITKDILNNPFMNLKLLA